MIMYSPERYGRDAAKARDAFIKAMDLGSDPTLEGRSSETPVGLRVRRSGLSTLHEK